MADGKSAGTAPRIGPILSPYRDTVVHPEESLVADPFTAIHAAALPVCAARINEACAAMDEDGQPAL